MTVSIARTAVSVGNVTVSIARTTASIGKATVSIVRTAESVGKLTASIAWTTVSIGKLTASIAWTTASIGKATASIGQNWTAVTFRLIHYPNRLAGLTQHETPINSWGYGTFSLPAPYTGSLRPIPMGYPVWHWGYRLF
jgi:hypothetical protein